MKRLVRPVRATCGLALALLAADSAAIAAPAEECKLVNFLVVAGLNAEQRALTHEKVAFSLGFRPARGFLDAPAAATVDWGDGTVENSGPRTIRMGIGTATTLRLEHAYQKPGKYVAAVKGGSLDGAPCTFENWFFPAQVTVIENPVHTRAVHVVATPAPATLAQKKLVVLPTPTPTPASASAISRKAKVLVPTPTPVKTYSISK